AESWPSSVAEGGSSRTWPQRPHVAVGRSSTRGTPPTAWHSGHSNVSSIGDFFEGGLRRRVIKPQFIRTAGPRAGPTLEHDPGRPREDQGRELAEEDQGHPDVEDARRRLRRADLDRLPRQHGGHGGT